MADNQDKGTLTLHEAAARGLLPIIRQRLTEGADVNELDSAGWTALHVAVRDGQVDAVKALLEAGANIDAHLGSAPMTALHMACYTINRAMIEQVLAYRPDLEARLDGNTPLHIAISVGDAHIVQLLLAAGADAKARMLGEVGDGGSVLHMAVSWYKTGLLPLLLQHGADPKVAAANPEGQTVLHLAAQHGNAEAIRILVAAGADALATFPDGTTALHVAAYHGHVKVAEALLDAGTDISSPDKNGEVPLYMATIRNQLNMVSFLLAKGAGSTSAELRTRIAMSAASSGLLGMVQFLEEAGFDMLAQDEAGETSLSVASYRGHKDVAVYLLKQGADIHHRSSFGTAAVDMARISGNEDVVRLLEQAEEQLTTDPHAELFPNWQSTNNDTDSPSQYEMMASLLSVLETRRVHPNQDAAGAVNCAVCKDLDFRRGMPSDLHVIYFLEPSLMATAASRGCRGCQFISDCVSTIQQAHGSGVLESAPEGVPAEPFVLHSMAQGAPLLIQTSGLRSTSGVRIEVYVDKDSVAPTWPTVGCAREAHPCKWTAGRAEIATSFLSDCISSHESCATELVALPKRVVYVGSESDPPRLYISNGEKARYATLSHAWGGSSTASFVVTAENVVQMQQGLPYEVLPRTFRDAIAVTRSLGIEYLWIDALCILQNSDDDWAQESAKMSSIYLGCHVMIAADVSSDADHGCFPREQYASNHRFTSVGPWSSRTQVNVRLTALRDAFQMEVGHRTGEAGPPDRSILNRRGWALQQRVLAPRILHLGKSEFAWECGQTLACECQTVRTRVDAESRFKAMMGSLPLRQAAATKAIGSDNGGVDARLWMSIVQELTSRQLTLPSDTLPALSGLAHLMAIATAAEYFCGIWNKWLEEFLMWRTGFKVAGLRMGGAPQPFGLQDADMPPPIRQPPQYAPSWSWASVVSPIIFNAGRHDISKRDQISHINKDGTIEDDVSKWRKSLLQQPKITYDCIGQSAKQASLTSTCEIVDVIWTSKDKTPSVARSEHGGTLTYSGATTQASEGEQLTADFEPDVMDQDLDVKMGDHLTLMFVIRDTDGIIAVEGTFPNGRKYVSGVKCTTLEGLVLLPAEPVDGSSKSTYRRVGIFETAESKWRQVARLQTITVI